MKALLDTHVLLWILADPDRIAPPVRQDLASRQTTLVVSAISALEIATKIRSGKLEAPGLLEAWSGRLREVAAHELSVMADHALLAGSMPWEHRDPFDRLLVAQAVIENLTLVTVDRALTGLPSPRILTW